MLYYRSKVVWQLVESTYEFHNRWGTSRDKLVRSRKLFEEVSEFHHVVFIHADAEEVAEEAVDVIVTLVGVLLTSDKLKIDVIEDYFDSGNSQIRPQIGKDIEATQAMHRFALDLVEFLSATYKEDKPPIQPFFWAIDTVFQIAHLSGVPDDVMKNAIEKVIAKNDAKTAETHYIDDKGMVSRRPNGAVSTTLSS